VTVVADRVVPAHEVLLHLHGLDGSVSTAEIVAYIDRSAAPPDVRATVHRLPDRRWPSVEDAVAALGTGWASDTDPTP
jgi:hypothetical protein